MPDHPYLSESEIRVLVGDMIKDHEEAISQPKHIENKTTLETLVKKVDAVILSQAKSEATQAIVMKFVGGGVVVWAIRQLVELVQSLHH